MSQNSRHSRFLSPRALLAVAVTAFFYISGVLIIWWLLLFISFVVGMSPNTTTLFFTLVLAIVILILILPRADKFKAPGALVTAEDHPLLFERLRSIAASAGTRMPDDVYVIWDHDAYVMYVGVLRQRHMFAFGYSFLCVLDISEFTAIATHEFAHYRARRHLVDPWIQRAQLVVTHTLHKLANRKLGPFRGLLDGYGDLFTRTTRAVLREQELAADRYTASMVGSTIMISALGKIAGYKRLVDTTMEHFVKPALARGYRPPLTQGLLALFIDPEMGAAARKFTDEIVAREASSKGAHPGLRERMVALRALPPGERWPEGEADPAFVLLGKNVESIENQLLETVMTPERVATLRPLDGKDPVEVLYFDVWRRHRDSNRGLIESWTMDELGGLFDDANVNVELVRDVEGNRVEPKERYPWLLRLASSCLSLALSEAGYTFVARPDTGLFFFRDDETGRHVAETPELVTDIVFKEITQADWVAFCKRAGITGMLLSGGRSPAGPGDRWLSSTPKERLKALGLRLEGSDGSSFERRIMVAGATTEAVCIEGERAAIAAVFGPEQKNWRLVARREDGRENRHLHVVDIVLANGDCRSLVFDVTPSSVYWTRNTTDVRRETSA